MLPKCSQLPYLTLYATRCAISAMFGLYLAEWLHLGRTIWVPISALIVSRDNWTQTRENVPGLFIGTVIGGLIALGAHEFGALLHWSTNQQLGLAIALAALVAHGRPTVRSCMWNPPIILLTASSPARIPEAAWNRSSEVLLGGLIGIAVQWMETRGLDAYGDWDKKRKIERGEIAD